MIPITWYSRKGKSKEMVKNQWLPGSGMRRDEKVEHRGFLGHCNYSLWYYSGGYMLLHILLNPWNIQYSEPECKQRTVGDYDGSVWVHLLSQMSYSGGGYWQWGRLYTCGDSDYRKLCSPLNFAMNLKLLLKNKNLLNNWILFSHKKEQNWVSWSDVDEPRACHTKWSKSEREKQVSYINTYMLNLEEWYWWTYLQDRNRGMDINNRHVDTVG